MNTRKTEMLDFMKRNSITVSKPLTTKPVLLERIKIASIQKKFAIDDIACENWHQLKSEVRRQNVHAVVSEKKKLTEHGFAKG